MPEGGHQVPLYSHDLSVFLACPESDTFEFVARDLTQP